MLTFSRYVFRQAAGVLLLILLSLGGIVWIGLALRELNVVTSQGQNAWTLLQMTTLALPNLLGVIAPFALLIAVVQVLSRLNGDSELIVLTASGATVWTVARPLLLLAFIVSLAVSFVNHVGMPWSLRTLREYVLQVRTDLLTQVIQPGRFSSPEPGLTFHIRDRAQNGELLGLIMHDARKAPQTQSFLATRGVIVKQDATSYLIMTDGNIVNRDDPKDPAQIIAFEKYAIDLDQFEPKGGDSGDLKPRERYLTELLWPDKKSQSFKKSAGYFRSELHERFSNPLYPFAFVMIALATVGQAQSTRQNRVASVLTGLVVAAGARLGGLALNNIVVLSAAAVPLLYAVPLAAIVLSAIAIRRAARPTAGARLTDRLSDAFAALRARLPAWGSARRLAASGGR